MLPNNLTWSYKRYKEDTNIFTTWLCSTAQLCGYRGSTKDTKQVTVGRLKGKARKGAKAEAMASAKQNHPSESITKLANSVTTQGPVKKYQVSTKELLNQAEAVAASSKFKVPIEIKDVLNRCINARERCTQFFQENETESRESTEGHRHFIEILQSALKILDPCFAKVKTGPVILDKSGKSDPENRFENLVVEDVSEQFENFIPTETPEASRNYQKRSKTKKQPRKAYELVDDSFDDEVFAIFCLFEDLNKVRTFLISLWQQYSSGNTELVTASMVTNAALGLVREWENEMIASDEIKYQRPNSYDCIAQQLWSTDYDPRRAETNPIKCTKYDDFIFFNTARIYAKYHALKLPKNPYPRHVFPLRIRYLDRPDIWDSAEVKDWEDEDVYLTQMLMEQELYEHVKKTVSEGDPIHTAAVGPPPVPDEISKALFRSAEGTEYSVHTVFASRIILDIRKVMGESIGRGREELLSIANHCQYVIEDDEVETDDYHPAKYFDVLPEAVFGDKIKALQSFWISTKLTPFVPVIKKSILEEEAKGIDYSALWRQKLPKFSPKQKEKVLRYYQGLGDDTRSAEEIEEDLKKAVRLMEPNEDLEFIMSGNPLFCGTIALSLLADMEGAGLEFSNWHVGIFLGAHLYNALKATNTIKKTWPAMEEMIDQHVKTLFMGRRPLDMKEFETHFKLRCGLSLEAFASGRRKGYSERLMKKFRHETMRSSETGKTLRVYYHGTESIERINYQLQKLMQQNTERNDKKAVDLQLDPIGYLESLTDWLPSQVKNMQVKYFELNRLSYRVLHHVREALAQTTGCRYPHMRIGENSQDYGYAYMVSQIIFIDYDRVHSEKGSEMALLRIAGKVMETFLGQIAVE